MPTQNPEPACHAPWVQGWHGGAHHMASPNFGPRPAQACVDLIVVHSISLPPGEYGSQAVQDLFMNRLDWDAHPYFQSIRGMWGEALRHAFAALPEPDWLSAAR